MTSEIFAEWLCAQGHTVIRTESSYWYDQGPRVYQSFPYHMVIHPSKYELLDLLIKHKVIGLRYSTSLSEQCGTISYHAICEDTHYELEILNKWARKNVRRGLKNCAVEPISFTRLAEEGWALQLDTLDRQGRELKMSENTWHRRCLSAADLPGFEAWGAIVSGELAASVITFNMRGCCYMLYQQCHRKYLQAHVNNALSYVVTKTILSRHEIKSILYGLHSLDALPSIDDFKFRMGYCAKPVRQRVVFHPLLAPLFNESTHTIIRKVLDKWPGNATLAKTEGFLRFYIEGSRGLSEQTWPECLAHRKEELIRLAC